MTKTQAAAYLAGMIDGEGCVRVQKNRSVSVSSTDWELIEACIECCELLGLRHRTVPIKARPEINKKAAWEMFISGKESLETIHRLVPLRCHRKRAALNEAIAAYKQLPRPPKEWLEQKYHAEGMSLQQVAEAWGAKNSVSAMSWMDYYGIPRRSQSESQRKHKRPDEAWLREQYWDNGLGLGAIARLTGAPHASTVWGWMRQYGIPTRPTTRRKE